MTIGEKRYRENSGERHLADGKTIRCQAVAKGRVRQWRADHQDEETPTDMLWPECQCTRAAEPGTYVCHYHGGMTPSRRRPRGILDVMPYDLAEKMATLLQNPDYISRREDIQLIRARQWELLEELGQTLGSEEAWGIVYDALLQLRKGNINDADRMLAEALSKTREKKDIWNEIYRAEGVLNNLTATEVKTAKELRLMASLDQVTFLIQQIQEIISDAGKKYIDDTQQRQAFLRFAARRIAELTNVSPAVVIDAIDAGSG